MTTVEIGTIEGPQTGYQPGNSPETAAETLTKILSNAFGALTIFAGLMFLLYFVLGGISWLNSGGKQDQIEKAKKQMTNAAIGLVIVVAAYGVAFIIGKVLGVEILNPAKYILNYLGPRSATNPPDTLIPVHKQP